MIVLQALRRCHANPPLRQLHWLLVRHRINYKLAVMTYKIHSTGLPAYLIHHINPRETTRTLRSSDTVLLTLPFTRTELAKCAFRCTAPSVWNSLPSLVTSSGSLTTFKSRRLKTYFFVYRLTVAYTSNLSHFLQCFTTLWRFINQFIIIIIIIIVNHVGEKLTEKPCNTCCCGCWHLWPPTVNRVSAYISVLC